MNHSNISSQKLSIHCALNNIVTNSFRVPVKNRIIIHIWRVIGERCNNLEQMVSFESEREHQ